MWEQSKAAKRRYYDGAFHSRYFVGEGVDIGGGPDPLGQYVNIFPCIQSCRTWDLEDGDAQFMAGVADGTFDFVHSSHCLEHMVDPKLALEHWFRVLKPGGFLIVTIPDENLYEHELRPSRFNSDHKWSFTMCKSNSPMPKSINVIDLAKHFCDVASLERLVLHHDFFRAELGNLDQTMTPVAECAIEVIWRKND